MREEIGTHANDVGKKRIRHRGTSCLGRDSNPRVPVTQPFVGDLNRYCFRLLISADDKVEAGTPCAVSRVGVNKALRLHDLTAKVCGLRHHSFCFAHLPGKKEFAVQPRHRLRE